MLYLKGISLHNVDKGLEFEDAVTLDIPRQGDHYACLNGRYCGVRSGNTRTYGLYLILTPKTIKKQFTFTVDDARKNYKATKEQRTNAIISETLEIINKHSQNYQGITITDCGNHRVQDFWKKCDEIQCYATKTLVSLGFSIYRDKLSPNSYQTIISWD